MIDRIRRVKIRALLIKVGLLAVFCLTGSHSVIRAAGDETIVPVRLNIPASVVVPGPKIYLSDLGMIEGNRDTASAAEIQGIDLGAAPLPGRERRLTREYLEFILKQHRLNTKISLTMDQAVVIKVDATSISAAEIQQMVEKLLPPKSPDYRDRTLAFVNLPSEIWLEKGDYHLEAASLGKIPEFGNVVFRIEVFNNGEKKKTINVCAKISVTATVYRAMRDLGPKDVLKDEDFSAATQELSSGREIVGKIPVGCRMVRSINPGEILEKQDIEIIPAVTKDGEVAVSVKVDGVEITIKAIAKSDAWIGDELQLYNPASKKIFKGRVIGKNLVEVSVE